MDVAVRVLVSFVLIALTFSTSTALQNAEQIARSKLSDDRIVYTETAVAARRSPDLERLRSNYERLLDSADVLIEERTRDAWLLLGLLAFVLVTGINSYRAHKESNRIRAALAFILTSQGRAFAELLQRQRLREEVATRHQAAHPASAP